MSGTILGLYTITIYHANKGVLQGLLGPTITQNQIATKIGLFQLDGKL